MNNIVVPFPCISKRYTSFLNVFKLYSFGIGKLSFDIIEENILCISLIKVHITSFYNDVGGFSLIRTNYLSRLLSCTVHVARSIGLGCP